MAEGINTLIKDKELRLRLAEKGANSLERFKIDTIYNKYLDIFESIMAK